MSLYIISNYKSGLILGSYEGDTPEQAISSMLADAGCEDDVDAYVVASLVCDSGVAVMDMDVIPSAVLSSEDDMEPYLHVWVTVSYGGKVASGYVSTECDGEPLAGSACASDWVSESILDLLDGMSANELTHALGEISSRIVEYAKND